MKITAGFRTWKDPYRVKWITTRAPMEKHKPTLYAVSFYDDKMKRMLSLFQCPKN